MTTSNMPPRMQLLGRLLDAYERSRSYGKPGPWPRDVILGVDAATFPGAFAPDGREERLLLLQAASDLERDGCLRLARHVRGPLEGEPRQIRLGPDEVSKAYEAARAQGYEPLATALGEVGRHVAALAPCAGALWFDEYLRNLALGCQSADPSVLGMSRERFKREWRDAVPALTVASALATGIAPAWERVISERLLGDSKALGRVRTLVTALLLRADPRWDGVQQDEATDLLEAYGVRRKPGLIPCSGEAVLRVGSGEYRLEDFEPVAHIPQSWGDAWVRAIADAGTRQVTTIENEYPFLSYVEEAGGARGLGARGEVVVYTGGFPTPGLIGVLAQLAGSATGMNFRHWGDADVGGLRIWAFIRAELGRPVELFRTTAAWVQQESPSGGRPLSSSERGALVRLGEKLEGSTDDIAAARELISALLDCGVKLEQERY